MGSSSTTKLLCLFVIFGLAIPSFATTYIVPWKVMSTELATFPVGKKFYVGDILLFQYTPFVSAVFIVDFLGYLGCLPSRGYSPDVNLTGNTSVTLNTTGPLYFISYFQDCLLGGQRLLVYAFERS